VTYALALVLLLLSGCAVALGDNSTSAVYTNTDMDQETRIERLKKAPKE